MRKLGHGQSVVFCAPPEIDRQICKLAESSPGTMSHAYNIIRWAIDETLSEIDRYIPQWAEQGVDHHQRQKAYAEYSSSFDTAVIRETWRQRESKTLEELYGLDTPSSDDANHLAFQLPAIRDRLRSFGITKLSRAGYGEEQEREVAQEIEQEREVERPPQVKPERPFLHPHVKEFISTGRLNFTSNQFIPAVNLLPDIPHTLKQTWPTGLYVTRDFSRTIEASGSQHILDFMRPVNWVISGTAYGYNPVFVVVSPHEVNELLPNIQTSRSCRLHVFNPRVANWMRSFSDLSFCTISGVAPSPFRHPSMMIQSQLGLISGQLYLDNVEMYRIAEGLLGIRRVDEGGSQRIECNGLVLNCFKDVVGSRRKGMGYSETHVGKILHLRPLNDDDLGD